MWFNFPFSRYWNVWSWKSYLRFRNCSSFPPIRPSTSPFLTNLSFHFLYSLFVQLNLPKSHYQLCLAQQPPFSPSKNVPFLPSSICSVAKKSGRLSISRSSDLKTSCNGFSPAIVLQQGLWCSSGNRRSRSVPMSLSWQRDDRSKSPFSKKNMAVQNLGMEYVCNIIGGSLVMSNYCDNDIPLSYLFYCIFRQK